MTEQGTTSEDTKLKELVGSLHELVPLKLLSDTVGLREAIDGLDGAQFAAFKNALIDLYLHVGLLDPAINRAIEHLTGSPD